MLYQFKQAVFLAGKAYPLGVNEVDEKTENDPHFLKFVKAQFITEADAVQVVSPETPTERAERLLEKLANRKPYRSVPVEAVEAKSESYPEKKDEKKSKKSRG